jgi:hypothetical protein
MGRIPYTAVCGVGGFTPRKCGEDRCMKVRNLALQFALRWVSFSFAVSAESSVQHLQNIFSFIVLQSLPFCLTFFFFLFHCSTQLNPDLY